MSLHPDLAALRARYDELYAAAQAGHVSAEDATATLTGLSVTDGTGARWQVDIHGRFVTAAYPGAEPAEADPARYVGPESVVSNPETGAYDIGHHPAEPSAADPFAGHDPFAVPGDGATGGVGTFGGGFGQQPPVEGSWAGPDAWAGGTAPAGGTDPIGRAVTEPPARSLRAAEHRPEAPRLAAAVTGFARRNRVLLAIVVVAAALVAFGLRGGDEASPVPTGPSPAAEAPGDRGEFSPDPAAGAAAPAPEAPAAGRPSADRPGRKQVARTLATYRSGNRARVRGTLATAAEETQVATAAAFFAGLDEAGLRARPGHLVAAGDGRATGTWDVRSGGRLVLRIPVTWVHADGRWQLADVPRPQ